MWETMRPQPFQLTLAWYKYTVRLMINFIDLLKLMLMVLGSVSVLGILLFVVMAWRLNPDVQTPRVTANLDYTRLLHRRRMVYGVLHEEEDDIVYAIGCAKVLGDEETARRLLSLYTASIPRKS